MTCQFTNNAPASQRVLGLDMHIGCLWRIDMRNSDRWQAANGSEAIERHQTLPSGRCWRKLQVWQTALYLFLLTAQSPAVFPVVWHSLCTHCATAQLTSHHAIAGLLSPADLIEDSTVIWCPHGLYAVFPKQVCSCTCVV